jgi:hypothetical protein
MQPGICPKQDTSPKSLTADHQKRKLERYTETADASNRIYTESRGGREFYFTGTLKLAAPKIIDSREGLILRFY